MNTFFLALLPLLAIFGTTLYFWKRGFKRRKEEINGLRNKTIKQQKETRMELKKLNKELQTFLKEKNIEEAIKKTDLVIQELRNKK